MVKVDLNEVYVAGAATVERVENGLRPWRLPHNDRHQFPAPNDSLMERAGWTNAIRTPPASTSRRNTSPNT